MKGLTPWPMVVQMRTGDCGNPIGEVFKRFEEGAGEDLGYFFGVAAGNALRAGGRASTPNLSAGRQVPGALYVLHQ
jgi:hypothetical protein